jgi:hypothetical protein
MQRLILDYSPWLIFPALLLAFAAAWTLYQSDGKWSVQTNRILFLLRFLLFFLITFLLLGPVIKLIFNKTEKPAVAIILDQSLSMWLGDSISAKNIIPQLKDFQENLESSGYEVNLNDLGGNALYENFNSASSDLNGALHQAMLDYEGKNLSGVILITDGIYNTGFSPLYNPVGKPVYTLGFGDTTQRRDLKIKSLRYNSITYLGNRFPVRAEIQILGELEGSFDISATYKGRNLTTQRVVVRPDQKSISIDFLLEAEEVGLQRIDFIATPFSGERNKENNKYSAFIEVLESRKKILLISPAPHPDIKMIRSVLEKNGNYECKVISEFNGDQDVNNLANEKPDLIIFNQAPDLKNLTTSLVNRLMNLETPALFIIGQQSALKSLPAVGVPLVFESFEWDEVFGVANSEFGEFALPGQLSDILYRMPPMTAPFGKFQFPSAKILLQQRIGNVSTDRPLLFIIEQQDRRLGILAAEGIWRWRLREYDLTEKTENTDGLILKLVQYLGSTDQKRKFKCKPVQQEFYEGTSVSFDVQIFDQLFEPAYNIPVTLEIYDEQNKKSVFEFTPAPGKTKININTESGLYRYKASIKRNDQEESDEGAFSVIPMQLESQDLTADFFVLRQISKSTGGKFYPFREWKKLQDYLDVNMAPGRIYAVNDYLSLIDLKLIFFFMLCLVSVEWFLRKYSGEY